MNRYSFKVYVWNILNFKFKAKEKKMSTTCKDCSYFFPVPENAGDYAPEKGDCVTEKEDTKGRYWLSKPTTNSSPLCPKFNQSR